MQQQALEDSIVAFERWQSEIGAKRMRIAALMRYGIVKSRTNERTVTPVPARLDANLQVCRTLLGWYLSRLAAGTFGENTAYRSAQR